MSSDNFWKNNKLKLQVAEEICVILQLSKVEASELGIRPMIYKPNIFSFKRNERDSFS